MFNEENALPPDYFNPNTWFSCQVEKYPTKIEPFYCNVNRNGTRFRVVDTKQDLSIFQYKKGKDGKKRPFGINPFLFGVKKNIKYGNPPNTKEIVEGNPFFLLSLIPDLYDHTDARKCIYEKIFDLCALTVPVEFFVGDNYIYGVRRPSSWYHAINFPKSTEEELEDQPPIPHTFIDHRIQNLRAYAQPPRKLANGEEECVIC